MKNIYEEAYRSILSANFNDYYGKDRIIEKPIVELDINPLAKLDLNIPFYVVLVKVDGGLNSREVTELFDAKIIFLHDVSDLESHNLFSGKFSVDEREFIKERLNEHSEYTNNVVDLIFNRRKHPLENVRVASQLHYIISNCRQPGEVTQYHLCKEENISIAPTALEIVRDLVFTRKQKLNLINKLKSAQYGLSSVLSNIE